MAKKSVKFYKSDLQPSNSTQGSLWFDTTNKVIHLNDTSGWITFDNKVSMTNLKDTGELIGTLNVGSELYNIKAPTISISVTPDTKPEGVSENNLIEVTKNVSNDGHNITVTKKYVSAIGHIHDASEIKTGVLDIARIPEAALERCVVVANDKAKDALTVKDVQLGDTVKVTETGNMYFVSNIDENNKISYEVYSVVIPWRNITEKPSYLKTINTDSNSVVATVYDDEIAINGGNAISTEAEGKIITIHHEDISKTDSTSESGITDNGKFSAISSITCNAQGHVTDINTKTYTLPVASDSLTGTVKLGYVENNKNYPVEKTEENRLFVTVPWKDTNTDTYLTEVNWNDTGSPMEVKFSFKDQDPTKEIIWDASHTHANYLDKVSTSDQTVKANIICEKNVTATAFYEKSDKRLKNIKKPLYNTLKNIYSIPTVYFNWKDDPEKNELGTIAQEVAKVYPEVVYETQDDILAVNYSKLAIVALAAIKELNEKLEESNKKILELEKRINHGR